MKFGDIVKFKNWECVYLMETPEIIYLARILDEEISKSLIAQRQKIFTQGSKSMGYKQGMLKWSFVELSTAEYKERIAHYGQPDFDPEDIIDHISVLNVEDQKVLQTEIKNDPNVAKKLREHIAKLKIEEA